MKHILLTITIAVLAGIQAVNAQVLNVQASGVARVDNQASVYYYENDNYSFSIVPDREMVVISRNTGNSFGYTGTYKIEYATTVYDNEMGKAYSFAISHNNTVYVMTMTKNIISFSKMGDQSRMWHFYLTKSVNL